MKKKFNLVILSLSIISCSTVNKNIVIVDVAEFDRATIAREIQILDSLNPAVLGIDLEFPTRQYSFSDSILSETLKRAQNLIMISFIENYVPLSNSVYDSLSGSLPEFLNNAKTGFSNAIFEDDGLHTLKRFSPSEKVKDKIEYHFAVSVAMCYDSARTTKFIKNNPRVCTISYSGNAERFKIFSAQSVLQKRISAIDIQGKIVLIGSFSPYDRDIFFSPLNSHREPLQPDMFGVVYLANIVAQVLDK